MMWRVFLVVLAIQLGLAPAARAGILFWRKKEQPAPTAPTQAPPLPAPLPAVPAPPLPAPGQRVAELVQTLKSDPNEGKRIAAIAELRQFDAATNPEIVPTLVETLKGDPRPNVRSEAAQSLGQVPPSREVVAALEQAANGDSARGVRSQAHSVLTRYQKNSARKTESVPPASVTRQEPPLAETPARPAPRLAPVPTVPTSMARPMPNAPPQSPLVPAEPPALQPAPPSGDGPALAPP